MEAWLLTQSRVLGTPTDEVWPGVMSLPDYKSSFPRWNGVPLSKAVPTLDNSGLDLLKRMLIYDPAGRISGTYKIILYISPDSIPSPIAKSSLPHPYFESAVAAH